MKRLALLLIIILVSVTAQGCKKSYPEGSAAESIRAICEQEYKVDVKVEAAGKTIGALIVQPDAILKDVSLSDRAFNKIEHVMLTASRVTLSSEFKYDFFVVSILDPDAGVQVSFVRYIKDIRRLITDDISRDDYFQRMIIETDFVPPVKEGEEAVYQLKEYNLKDFLAMQIGERIKMQFMVNLIVKRLFQIGSITTTYQPVPALADRFPDAGRLIVEVQFLPDAPAFNEMGNETLRADFNVLILNTAKKVYRRYDFKDCEGLIIRDNRGQQLASYNREELNKGNTNVLMQLIESIKKK